MPFQASTRSKLSAINPVCTESDPHPNPPHVDAKHRVAMTGRGQTADDVRHRLT